MGDFLPDGSYLAQITSGGITLTVRVIEYQGSVALAHQLMGRLSGTAA